ncbi:hypothetical protein HYX04_01120 [Candidatus Woesearchaeota archaeon]|nr:hypothetical protein [Candidatus Woesearchaeota archaeon]
MRGLVIFSIALVLIVSVSFAAANISNEKSQVKENSKVLEFSTFTSAVCEDRQDHVYCKDEFFINCNGEVSKASDVAECNGIKLEVPKTLGFAVFDKEWKDPRG